VANVFEPHFDPADDEDRPGFVGRRARVGRQAGARNLGASVYELPPGQSLCPYHWQSANEEMIVVISGRPSIRTPDGWRDLDEGDLVPFRRGAEGAHQVANRGDSVARVLMLSEMNAPELVVYPDSNKAGILSSAPGTPATDDEIAAWFRFDDAVDYWEGEEPPGQA
jgi:uncharacterized cupin superfamily protein